MDILDSNGQPINKNLNERRRVDRSLHEMLGLIRGVLIDGVVSESEANALRDWITANPDVVKVWPGSILAERLDRIFNDGIVEDSERIDLKELMEAIVGLDREAPETINAATSLPLDTPAPDVIFCEKIFVFTGKFVFGTRKYCQQTVLSLGGLCADNISQKIDYLVIGMIGSRDWIQTSWGRKIENAVELRERGFPIRIISEEHWTSAVHSCGIQ